MPVTVNTYTVSNIKQLVDLNGSFTNFECKFNVTAKEGEFNMVVANQDMLDSGVDLDFKKVVNGSQSGEVRVDTNIYQNYFLVMKAEKECQVSVEVDITELPETSLQPQNNTFTNENAINWTRIFLVVGLVLVLAFVMWNYTGIIQNSKSSSIKLDSVPTALLESNNVIPTSSTLQELPKLPTPTPTPTLNTLSSKLNKFPIE